MVAREEGSTSSNFNAYLTLKCKVYSFYNIVHILLRMMQNLFALCTFKCVSNNYGNVDWSAPPGHSIRSCVNSRRWKVSKQSMDTRWLYSN